MRIAGTPTQVSSKVPASTLPVGEALVKVSATPCLTDQEMIKVIRPFGYPTQPHLFGFSRSSALQVFQIHDWPVRKRPVVIRHQIKAQHSRGLQLNECVAP